jgi:peptide/nickel transport system ATP-binding protein
MRIVPCSVCNCIIRVKNDLMTLLAVRGLTTSFPSANGRVCAIDGVSVDVGAGEIVALVGESGCGKSITALSIMRLLPEPQAKYEQGEILFEGHDVLKLSASELRHLRGNRISMIFQEPMTSLNPVYTVGAQIAEGLRLHRKTSRREARARSLELLGDVGIPSPEANLDAYPHQLSGGMRQRVMIAMALACEPALLIADEPTTALDVTIQAQILDLLLKLRRDRGLGILLITHDLGLVAEYTDRVYVMYAGQIVEQAGAADLFRSPAHPYTRGLLGSLPKAGSSQRVGKRERLTTIEGTVPSLGNFPSGCRFRDRCLAAKPQCAKATGGLLDVFAPASATGEAADASDVSTSPVAMLRQQQTRCIRWEEL